MILENPQVLRRRIGCRCRVPYRRAPCSTASCPHHRHCNRPIRTPRPARNPVSFAPDWCRRPTSVCPESPAIQIAWSTPCPTAPSNRSPRTGHYHRRWLPCPNPRTSSKVSIVRRPCPAPAPAPASGNREVLLRILFPTFFKKIFLKTHAYRWFREAITEFSEPWLPKKRSFPTQFSEEPPKFEEFRYIVGQETETQTAYLHPFFIPFMVVRRAHDAIDVWLG